MKQISASLSRMVGVVFALLLISSAAYAISSVDQGFQAGWFTGDGANITGVNINVSNATGVLPRANSNPNTAYNNSVNTWSAVQTLNGANLAGTAYQNQSFQNLLKNGDFESWSAGAAAAPDFWTLQAGTIAKDTVNKKTGTAGVALTRIGIDMFLIQTWPTFPNPETYSGKTYTLGAWVKSSSAGAMIGMASNAGAENIYHSGGGGWEFLTATITLPDPTTSFRIWLGLYNDNVTAYFDGAILVEGSVVPAFSPNPYDWMFTYNASVNPHNMNASNITSGTLPDARLSSAYAKNAASGVAGLNAAGAITSSYQSPVNIKNTGGYYNITSDGTWIMFPPSGYWSTYIFDPITDTSSRTYSQVQTQNSIFAGSNVSISKNANGSITITSSGGGSGGGNVTAVTGSGNIYSSGGVTPDISFTGQLPVANGGTGASDAAQALINLGVLPNLVYGLTNLSFAGNTSGFNGNASLNLNYETSDARTVGMFVYPTYGSTVSSSQFLSAYNMKHGIGVNGSSPVPAGTKGALSGYDANINTAQAYTDIQPAGESGHGFGATIFASGGARYNVLDGVIHRSGTIGQTKGINIAFNNTAGVPTYQSANEITGMFVQTGGSGFTGTQYDITNGIQIYGNTTNADYFATNFKNSQGNFLKYSDDSNAGLGRVDRFVVNHYGQILMTDGNPGSRVWIDPTSVNPIIRLNNSVRYYQWQAVNAGDYLRLEIETTGTVITVSSTGVVTLANLAGTGTDYVCVNAAGTLIRQDAAC